ncbi:MIB [Mytilus edulis]|uniref:MIB n=1 Tax=Mytilus edulis TaxID=6550 RepID=A0A8S3QHT9_MYTED|nr:MIB [Mytilus edulis]
MEHIPLLHLPVMEEPVSKQTSREDNDLESKAKEPEDKKDNKIAKEIQGDLISQDGSFEYRKFNGYRVLNAYYGEKVKTDLRVIREKGDKNKASEDESLGTIVDVDYKAGEVKVQWDKNVHESPDTFRTDKHNQYELLLFDNAQSGVKHEHFSCDDCKQNPLLGIRWKCLICADYNLCTKCYITDRHDTEHIFYRLICPNSKRFQKNGIVKYYTNNRSTVGVQWKDKFEGNQHDEIKITDLVLKDGGKFRYYPDHLPILVQSADDYFEVDVHDCKPHEKIEVRIWHNVQNMQKKKKRTFKPTLYLIFANPWNDDNVKNLELMGEIIDFASQYKSKVVQTNKTCIRKVFELIVRGFKTFQRGDIIVDENEKDEIDYFKKWQAKNTQDVSLIWPREGAYETKREHKTDTRKPWRIKTTQDIKTQDIKSEDEIILITDIRYDNVEALVCYLIIAGYLKENPIAGKECHYKRRIDITKWDYECYGLVFLPCCKNSTGQIRIHHILFGCVLLEDEANSWKTSKIMKEKLQHLKSAFTESAIIITSCIYEADVKAAKEYSDGKKSGLGFLVLLNAYAYMLLFDYGDDGITNSDCFIIALIASFAVDEIKQIKDTIAFMIIMAVITVWFSVSNYALLYPNSQFSLAMIETILSNGVWMLFGELNLDADSLTVPHCSFNRTIYESEALPRCPTQLGLRLTPYLKAFYCLIAVILLLNLLIAIYSSTKSGFYWRQIQNNFLEEYCIKTIFPIHLQLLALLGTIISLCYYYQQGPLSSEEKLNNRPMVVRVFLYNTNYDLRLNTTKVAEENGTMHAKGKIDPKEFDAITRELDSNNTDQETTTEKDDKRISDIMNKLDKIDDISKELKEIKSMVCNPFHFISIFSVSKD